MNNWVSVCNLIPPEGVVVDTKIDDCKGCRNMQPLMRRGRLWFMPDETMYVYYVPTHWRERDTNDA